jgi:predicted DNA-binding ribbon-helix-helix protein
MKSPIIKRSVVIHGHKTSVSLEQPFWDAFRDLAEGEHISTSALLRKVDAERNNSNLSSAIRVFVLRRIREIAETRVPRHEGEHARTEWWAPSQVSTI